MSAKHLQEHDGATGAGAHSQPPSHDHDHGHDHGHDHDHDHDHETDNYDAAYAATPVTDDAAESSVAMPVAAGGYWRSLRELDGKAPFQTDKSNNEFPAGLVGDGAPVNPLHRRNFFHLMGASMALAGVGACRYEKEEIVPLARRPEDQVPGKTLQYATAWELGGVGHALVATSFEGRPIKLDGNPDHPFASGAIVPGTKSRAGISTFGLASILNLYDPDRSQNITTNGAGASLENFRANLKTIVGTLARLRILSEASSSPTLNAMRAQLVAENPGLVWHEYEAMSHDNERLGTKQAFGRPLRPIANLENAETIVALDADLFGDHPAHLRYARDWARRRRVNNVGKPMNRLYSIESAFTNTGAMADHRLGVRSEHGLAIALAIDAALSGGSAPKAEILLEAKPSRFLAALVEELQQKKAAGGKAVVIAGRKQSPEVHAIVARINEALGAVGVTLEYVEELNPERPSHLASITTLANDMKAGQVGSLIILGGNPVYDAPADLDFAGALAKVQSSVHLHEYINETSQKTTWHIPRAHFLEAWGDTMTWDGAVTIAQPLIAPLYGGITAIDLVAMVMGKDALGEDLVKGRHTAGGASWRKAVHDGFTSEMALARVTDAKVNGSLVTPTLTATQAAGSKRANGQLEVTFQPSSSSYDGRFANNAWLQETPDFLTKTVWDNYALVGPETAEVLGLANDTLIKLTVNGKDITLPCYVMPGQARYSIALVVGYGRTAAGRVGGKGTRTVGVNVYPVRTTTGFDVALGATATATGTDYTIASVQEHGEMRRGLVPQVQADGIAERLPELIREATAAEIEADPSWKTMGKDAEEYWDDNNIDSKGDPKRHLSLFQEHEYTTHRWGMAIDLSTCTGCNSCMVACQSENNIPVVGRSEVMNNREMHWIRIDRYFAGTPDDPQIVHQPVACQQCENAPCEQVCPVGATQHSNEGLNDMAYNRCIGTRYCANNCPYKVRKFNFLDWNKEWRDARNKVRRLLFNPQVTVRMRGVMEKCTFCVQRIQNAKIHARAAIRSGQRAGDLNLPVVEGEISTACQDACPTEAIVFGDLADPNSRVSRAHADGRAYDLLPEVYTKPRNQYLTRVRNPNPKLEPAKAAKSAHGEP